MTALASAIEDDRALLARFIAARDESAFAEIVARHAGLVYGASLRVLRDATAAQDATQETFLRLMRKPAAVRESVGGWLHRTATRIAIDAVRSESSRRTRERGYSEARPTGSVAVPGAGASEWDALSPIIDEALAELPADERALLVDHFLMGKTQRELLAESGESPATMSRRIRRALDAVRAGLKRKGVAVGTLSLVGLFQSLTAEAAPAPVVRELGKMALLSGAAPVAGFAGWAVWGEIGAVATIAGGAAVLTYLCVNMAIVTAGPTTRPSAAAVETPTSAPPAASTPPRYITLELRPMELDGTRVAAFQDPATSDGAKIAITFGDGRTVTMPIAEARALILRQTGKTPEEIVKNTVRGG